MLSSRTSIAGKHGDVLVAKQDARLLEPPRLASHKSLPGREGVP